MAQLKQCPNGHYFDPSMYPSCPYCSGASVGINRSVSDYGIKTSIPTGTVRPVETASAASSVSGTPTVSPGSNGETVKPITPVIEDIPLTKPARIERKPRTTSEQSRDSVLNNDDAEDVPQTSVVGWLVAVGGPYIGKSFELHHEYNYIGRETGDIVLAKDAQVSRVKNAWIMYSSRNNRFKFGAGESSNIVYVNDDELAANTSVVLHPYDQIEIGTSKFRFIPFCTEQFQW